MKICLLSGHSSKKSGAVCCAGKYKGFSEFDLAWEYLPALATELRRLGHEPHLTSRDFAGGTTPSYSAAAANTTGADIALEFHFNSAGNTATGTEVLYWGKSESGKRFAAGLSARVAQILDLRDRGALAVPTPDDRGTEAFRRSVMPFFMVEPCFAGSTPEDAVKLCRLIDSGEWALRVAYAIDCGVREVYAPLTTN